MNQQEQQQLKGLLVATSLYYGQDIADVAIRMFVEDLQDLTFLSVSSAIKELRRDPRINRLPLPAVIRSKIETPVTDEDEAREASARILAAIAKFGWCNSEQARAYVGELGWAVVDRQGGWTTVCQLVNDGNLSSFQAQWRDLAAALCRKSKAGTYGDAPALPHARPRDLASFNVSLLPMPKESQ